MAKIEIIKPNNTPEQEEKALMKIADALNSIAEEISGVQVRYTLEWAKDLNE